MEEAIKDGESKGHKISREELDLMLTDYYAARGWDPETGALLRPKLEELGLSYIADQLNL
jgi:aldehyde:ferredoxin oxidoreductase